VGAALGRGRRTTHSALSGRSPARVGGNLILGQGKRHLAPVALTSFYQSDVPAAAYGNLIRPQPRTYDHVRVQEVWHMVEPHADRLIRTFYAELFLRLPEATMMIPLDVTRQRHNFGRALVQWVVTDDAASMTAHLQQLGADHRKFGLEPKHYEVAGAALVSAIKAIAGSRWTAAHEIAILGSYARLASVMIDGAQRRAYEPATWGASIVDHQRVFHDLAVLRVQPDAPYPYDAGQYTTLEVPSHPHEWRRMSIASAPRADNTFDIQVRRVGAAGVSAALVAHARPGARLRLGPARGNDLVVKPGTMPRGLLCVASGIGAAPITAVIESILGWPDPPAQLHAFVGGRTQADIYPVTQLNWLIHAGSHWHRMHVQGVVSDDPTFRGLRGNVENVVPTFRPWAQLGVDVLIAGPNPMISTAVNSLVNLGVPLSRIHFDECELTD
jgi:NAD(P)H-flavin reductase/hemoglobin-like flavoprotein